MVSRPLLYDRPERTEALTYRPDIDGLRAIAILLVVAFHAFPESVKGGFVGVDIFFVISGYLISGVILAQLNEGRFSLYAFYAHRIRRIFPALIVVMLASFLIGWFVLLADEFEQLGKHIAAGAAFLSNIVLWQESGYFDKLAEAKPLLHLWSLGIEEQFYLLWPLFLLAIRASMARMLLATATIFIASFAVNVAGAGSDPVSTFYLPATRFWELLLGCMLSIHTNGAYFKHGIGMHLQTLRANIAELSPIALPTRIGPAELQSWLGISLICLGAICIDENARFPGWWALLPTAGAFFIIAAGPATWFNRNILGSPALVWVGIISYPLYLWHWPLLAFLRIVNGPDTSTLQLVATIFISFLLAWATYLFVERPVRSGGIGKAKIGILSVSMVMAGLVGYLAYYYDGFGHRMESLSVLAEQLSPAPYSQERAECRQLTHLSDGHCLFFKGREHPVSQTGLAGRIYILGDSHGEALSVGFAPVAGREQIDILSIGRSACPPLWGSDTLLNGMPQHCNATITPMFAYMNNGANKRDDVVVLAGRYSAYVEGRGFGQIKDDLASPDSLKLTGLGTEGNSNRQDTFEIGLTNTLHRLTESRKRVVFVHQVPELGFDPRTCINRPYATYTSGCKILRSSVIERQRHYRAVVQKVLVNFPDVVEFDPINLLCDEIYCYAIRDGEMMYLDDDHIGRKGAEMLVSHIVKQFRIIATQTD